MRCSLLVLLPVAAAIAAGGPRLALGAQLRSDFTLLSTRTVWEGKPLVYLDSAATSQKPKPVLAAMARHLAEDNANVHRGAHILSQCATESYEAARDKVAAFVGAADRREIVFTRGATEAINLVAASWGERLNAGDEIVLSVMEHHSNIVPWQLLAERRGVVLRYARYDAARGGLDLEHLGSLIGPSTKLVALAHVSNTLGCLAPVREIVALARAAGAAVLLDACQSVPHMPVDVQELGVDFLVASGHKMLGPTGIGFLWASLPMLESMPPWQGGGEMIDTVTLEGATYAPPPGRFEAGTPAITEAIGLGAAVDYLEALGMERVAEYEHALGKYLRDRLAEVPGIEIYGPGADQPRASLCAFNVAGVHPSDLAAFLDQEGIAIRAGHHCTQPLHAELGAPGSARASLYVYNTRDEVDALVEAVQSTVALFTSLDDNES